jgi:peptide/nickel transport system substrate-binding protein
MLRNDRWIIPILLMIAATWASPVTPQSQYRNPWEVWDYGTKPVRGGVFRTVNRVDAGVLNPNHRPVNDMYAIDYLYDRLLIPDGNERPAPWLAESWTFPNETTCIMKLKKGIRFSDGTPFNAEAVKFVEEWIMDSGNRCWSAPLLRPLKSIEVLDDSTVQWNFKEPWGAFLGVLSGAPGYMISPKALREDPRKCDNHPVGTGPYLFDDRSPGAWIRLKRNPDWWYGKSVGHPEMPYFEAILTTVIPDPSIAFANLKAGKIDRLSLVKSHFKQARTDPDLRAYAIPFNMLRGYRFNHSIPPFNDIRVRQAVAHAIDRKALIAGVEFGMGRIASCIFPDDHWAHNPDLKPWPFDPQKAKRFLKEAGYENGLTISGYVTNARFSNIDRAEAVKNMLAEVGINWKVEILDPVAAVGRSEKGKDHLVMGDDESIRDPDITATRFYHPAGDWNQGWSNNPAAITLIEKGRREMDPVRRQKIYKELERVLYENCEGIWLFYDVGPIAYRKEVLGFDPDMAVKHKRAWDLTHPMWFKDGKP